VFNHRSGELLAAWVLTRPAHSPFHEEPDAPLKPRFALALADPDLVLFKLGGKLLQPICCVRLTGVQPRLNPHEFAADLGCCRLARVQRHREIVVARRVLPRQYREAEQVAPLLAGVGGSCRQR
jgi:hypothetical protein